jgi:hypothetical protein
MIFLPHVVHNLESDPITLGRGRHVNSFGDFLRAVKSDPGPDQLTKNYLRTAKNR